jgi:hypothetical protein
MFPWIMLASQVMLAAVALHVLARRVYPALGQVRQGELVVDVWLPVALIIPLLFMVDGVDGSVRTAGWPSLGGPVLCGLIALAIAAMIGRGGIGVFGEEFAEGESIGWRLAPRITLVGLLGGLVLLLLGAAHIMSIWVGQAAFALAAIVLWINTPDSDHAADRLPAPAQVHAGFGMLIVLFCAFGQGVAGRMASVDGRPIAVAIMLSYAAIALAFAARQTSAGMCVRIGVWAASLGVLFALGVISILAMIPRVVVTFMGVELPPHSMLIAAGFGSFALEATLLMVLAPLAAGVLRLPGVLRVVIGIVILLFVLSRAAAGIVSLMPMANG